MCGIIGVIHGHPDAEAAAYLHEALYLLQHRGQDACGIATCAPGGRIYQCKGNGMASKVFHDGERVADLPGAMGIAHLRYPTAGSSANAEAQPFYVNSPYGICFTHNGNLINAPELKRFLDQEAHRHINTDSDSELMLNVFANELNETGKARVNSEDCFAALERMYRRCKGGWACTAMLAGFGLMAFRDPYGIRPLCLGSRTINGVTDYMMASESVALQSFECKPDDIRDILPGQAVIIEKGHEPQYRQVQPALAYSPDMFEYVYFARPDSVIDQISVYGARENMGKRLAQTIEKQLGPGVISEIDRVMPLPETANIAARFVAKHLCKELVDGFTKNRYIFRTFIMPSQKHRRTGVRRKLNAMQPEFQDKNVLLVDDSIVRGTTSQEIVQMARDAGARKVYIASCAPPVTHAHIYGIDLASSNELIAFHKSPNEVATAIGADDVIYQSLEDLESACAELSPRRPQRFEVGVFCGNYVTPVDDNYFEHLERIRGQTREAKVKERARAAVVNGVAKEEDIRLVVGEERDQEFSDSVANTAVNAEDMEKLTKSRRADYSVKHRQDISLDNLNDHS